MPQSAKGVPRWGVEIVVSDRTRLGHAEARDHAAGVEAAETVGDEVDGIVRRVAVEETLELSGPAVYAAGRAQGRHEDAIAGRLERGGDSREVANRRRTDSDSVEAEQAVHQDQRRA